MLLDKIKEMLLSEDEEIFYLGQNLLPQVEVFPEAQINQTKENIIVYVEVEEKYIIYQAGQVLSTNTVTVLRMEQMLSCLGTVHDTYKKTPITNLIYNIPIHPKYCRVYNYLSCLGKCNIKKFNFL